MIARRGTVAAISDNPPPSRHSRSVVEAGRAKKMLAADMGLPQSPRRYVPPRCSELPLPSSSASTVSRPNLAS